MIRKLLEKIGRFQTELIFSLTYFFIIFPSGLIFKIFSDPLRIKKKKKTSYWIERDFQKESLETLRRQY